MLRGEWPKLIDNPEYNNACATRLSYALRGAGVAIPKKYQEAVDGAGAPFALKMTTSAKFIKEQIGRRLEDEQTQGSARDLLKDRF